MRIVIIIPVYNEAEGIADFLSTLKDYLNRINTHEIWVLIFDSNSKDNTIEIVQKYQASWPALLLLTEPEKTGLGSAYIQGMNYAIHQLNADAVFQCDADGSHHPRYIEPMIQILEQGNDVIVGSRYVKGGSIDADWAWYRLFISKAGNYIARIILSNQYKDYTSGFKLIRSSILKSVLNKKFFSKEYAFQINLLWFLHQEKARIKETPIKFTDREKGYSKFPKNNIMQSLQVLFMLRKQDMKSYFKMCFCGLFGSIVQFILFNLLRSHLNTAIANAIAVEVVIMINFFTNNYFSFRKYRLRSNYSLKSWVKKVLFFFTISHGSLLIQTGTLVLGNSLLGSSVKLDNLLVFVGILIGTVWNYSLFKKFIWKKSSQEKTQTNPI